MLLQKPLVSSNRSATSLPLLGNGLMSESNVIKFYSVGDEYGEFSNFAAFPITVKGKRWPTSEHYFQAQKFKSAADQSEIRKAKSPMIAARLGRDRKKKLRRDWESAKVNVMRQVVLAKSSQHDELQELLLGTGDSQVIQFQLSGVKVRGCSLTLEEFSPVRGLYSRLYRRTRDLLMKEPL